MRSVVRLVLVAISVAFAAPALTVEIAAAQESKTPAVHDEQARAYFRAGAFELAAKEFENAFELSRKKPTRLYNAGLAYEKADMPREAVAAYAKYLENDPNGSKAVETRARKAALEQRIAEEDAKAADARAKEEQQEKARAQAQAATEHLRAGAYSKAAEAFAAAYRIDGDAQYLFEQAEALRLGGKTVEAIAGYRHYAREAPTGRRAAEARRRQDQLEEDERRAQAASERPIATATPGNKPATPAKRRTSYSTLRWVGVGGASLGAAVLGTSLVFGLKARSIESDLEGLEPSSNDRWSAAMNQKLRDGEDAASTGRALAIVGGGLTVVGTALFFIGGNEESNHLQTVSVRPVFHQAGGGFALGGSF